MTSPGAASSWRPGSRQTIEWSRSGTLTPMANITLRREGAPEYVVRAHVHVRHNLGREVRNVTIQCYVSRTPDGLPLLRSTGGEALLEGTWRFTIASLLPGQEINRFIEQEYYTSGGFPPTLSDGTTYYFLAKIVDDKDRFCDPNSRNDSDSRSFTTPD